MKILLINALGQDYLTVTVYHGLVSLGHDVTELNYMDFMRKSNKDKIQRETLYGKGYSYAFTIDDTAAICCIGVTLTPCPKAEVASSKSDTSFISKIIPFPSPLKSIPVLLPKPNLSK